jgi:signal transduction histidine kinase
VTGEDEIAQLSRSFNSMISDLHTTHVALKEQSRRLGEALREVEDVEAMKDSFLALVSHEVRTPLTSIMGGVEFLRDEFGEQHDEIQTEFMGIVYDSARRLAGFMNDAIMMASLQASRSRSSFESFSLTALLHSKFDEIVAPAAARGLVVENRMDRQREFFVHGDWTLLQVALDKVLHNAVRHNRAGGSVLVEVVERVLEDEEGDLARDTDARNGELSDPQVVWRAIRVFNTGPLIAPERIETLFARFELTHDISNHQRGSGLSLPIANYILGYHGGCIEVRPVADDGMAFYLVIPGRLSIQSRAPSSVALPDDIDDTVTTAHIVRAAAKEVERLEAGIAAAESEDRRRRHARDEVVSGPVDMVEVECESIGPGRR